jgi:hypothetical protein
MFPHPVFFVYATAASSVFFIANWGEYHTGMLRHAMHGFGLTECQWMLISTYFLNFVTENAMGNFRMRDLGMVLMPHISETNVQGKI